jgi:hypothetical protein
MHAALGVPELLDLILTSLADPKAKHVLNCALVSKDWANTALNILWRAPQRETPWILWNEVVTVLSEIIKAEINVFSHSLAVISKPQSDHLIYSVHYVQLIFLVPSDTAHLFDPSRSNSSKR